MYVMRQNDSLKLSKRKSDVPQSFAIIQPRTKRRRGGAASCLSEGGIIHQASYLWWSKHGKRIDP